MADSRYQRSLTHSIAHWTWFDQQIIDPEDVDQLRRVAAFLQADPTEVYLAIKRVGARAGDIRRYLHHGRR